MKNKIYDTLIIGTGIYGINIARLLTSKFPEMKIALIESNKSLYNNNSIFNSGVLHSGVYYKPGSLKAKYCVLGQKELIKYCDGNQIPIKKCGKVIVGRENEYSVIQNLYKNGLKNNVNLSLIDLKSAQDIDKHIVTDAEKVLYVPDTSIVSPKLIYESVLNSLKKKTNIDILFDCKVINLLNKNAFISNKKNFKDSFMIQTEKNQILNSKYVINCSGPSSDKIAKLFDQSSNYQNVHLKAIYHKYQLKEDNMPKTLVYPIPGPFSLGLHLTMEDETTLKFGPSVDFPILSLKDLNYNYKDFLRKNCELLKTFTIFRDYKQILIEFRNNSYNFGFKRLFEIYNRYDIKDLKYIQKKILIRTPAINLKTGSFESDFIIEHSKNNIHLINFQSPGWTSFLPVSRHIMDLFDNNLNNL